MPSKPKPWQWAVKTTSGYTTSPAWNRSTARYEGECISSRIGQPWAKVVKVRLVEVAPKKGAGR